MFLVSVPVAAPAWSLVLYWNLPKLTSLDPIWDGLALSQTWKVMSSSLILTCQRNLPDKASEGVRDFSQLKLDGHTQNNVCDQTHTHKQNHKPGNTSSVKIVSKCCQVHYRITHMNNLPNLCHWVDVGTSFIHSAFPTAISNFISVSV